MSEERPDEQQDLPKKPKHRYKLSDLEDKISDAYAAFQIDDTQLTRTKLYLTIKDLAYAILEVGKWNSVDFDEVSYEYAVYLFERLVLGTFKPRGYDNSRFPWQHYIRKNIRHVIMQVNNSNACWFELIEDLEQYVDEGSADFVEENTADLQVGRDSLSNKLFKSLRMFYPMEEIKRILPISVELISNKSRYLIKDIMPKDVREFSIILISLSKRLIHDHNINHDPDIPKSELVKMLSSSVRSTVFLSSVVNSTFFPKELLLALDIDSLYRLIQVMEGQTIRVPTLREMDTIIGSVVAVSKAITEGSDIEDGLKESKEKYGLIFSNHINVKSFISKSVESYNIFGENTVTTEPMINILLMSVKSLEILFKKLNRGIDGESSSELLDSYRVLSDSFNAFTKNLVNISDKCPLTPDTLK